MIVTKTTVMAIKQLKLKKKNNIKCQNKPHILHQHENIYNRKSLDSGTFRNSSANNNSVIPSRTTKK